LLEKDVQLVDIQALLGHESYHHADLYACWARAVEQAGGEYMR